jgi:hypothetical protein
MFILGLGKTKTELSMEEKNETGQCFVVAGSVGVILEFFSFFFRFPIQFYIPMDFLSNFLSFFFKVA